LFVEEENRAKKTMDSEPKIKVEIESDDERNLFTDDDMAYRNDYE
jgi:hypothetical protein